MRGRHNSRAMTGSPMKPSIMQSTMAQGIQKLRQWTVMLATGRESAHEIAMGAAIGAAIAVTPTLGFQMALAGMVAGLCRASIRTAAAAVWITNPLTAGPIYFACYWIGSCILPSDMPVDEDLTAATVTHVGFDVAMDVLVGSLAAAIVLGLLTYPIARAAVAWWRRDDIVKCA